MQDTSTSITTDQAAALLGIPPATIRSWVARGKVDPVRRGARPLRFTRSQFAELEHLARDQHEADRLAELGRAFLESA